MRLISLATIAFAALGLQLALPGIDQHRCYKSHGHCPPPRCLRHSPRCF